MKKYALKTKDGESIYKIDANNLFEAVERFSILKQMNTETLLKLFVIDQIIKI
jgi:hypothetical protein